MPLPLLMESKPCPSLKLRLAMGIAIGITMTLIMGLIVKLSMFITTKTEAVKILDEMKFEDKDDRETQREYALSSERHVSHIDANVYIDPPQPTGMLDSSIEK
jgi:hypothetical protein